MKKHFTASAFAFNNEGKGLLIFHPLGKMWFPPGGHTEENENSIETAVREVFEETGYKIKIIPEKFDHPEMMLTVPTSMSQHCVGGHFHVDSNYACILEDSKKYTSENLPEKWVSLDEARELLKNDLHTFERFERAHKKFLEYKKLL